MTSIATTYEFDAAFQTKIAALVARDNIFNRRTEGLIKPAYFDDDAEATLVHLALEHFAIYKMCATMGVLIKLLKDGVADKSISSELSFKDAIRRINDEDISDRDYVIDETAKFAKHQAIGKAIYESVDLLDAKEFDKIADLIKTATETGSNAEFAGLSLFGDIETRTHRRLDMASGKIKPSGITTGFHMLDETLYQKGWGRKELSVLMGAAKMGKTMALSDFAIRAALAGHNVLYTTLEVSKDILADRMDANISETPMKELVKNVKMIEGKIESIYKSAGELVLHEFPTGTMRPSDLRRLIARHGSDGVLFDLIVVDYADIMAPETPMNEERHNLKNIYVDLRALSYEETAPGGQCPAVLTATQTNRSGAKSVTATMTDVAEDFNKVRIADLVISINATEEEISMGEARLFFAACRNQAAGFQLRIKQSREHMKFITKIIGRDI